MTNPDMITIPRPKPDQAVIAVTDADGASAWVTVEKTDLQDGGLLRQMVPILEDGQRLLHEQRGQTDPVSV